MLKQHLLKPEIYLYLFASAVPICFASWAAMINNFSVEQDTAAFDFSTSFGAQSYGAIAKAYIVAPPSEPEHYEHQEKEIC